MGFLDHQQHDPYASHVSRLLVHGFSNQVSSQIYTNGSCFEKPHLIETKTVKNTNQQKLPVFFLKYFEQMH